MQPLGTVTGSTATDAYIPTSEACSCGVLLIPEAIKRAIGIGVVWTFKAERSSPCRSFKILERRSSLSIPLRNDEIPSIDENSPIVQILFWIKGGKRLQKSGICIPMKTKTCTTRYVPNFGPEHLLSLREIMYFQKTGSSSTTTAAKERKCRSCGMCPHTKWPGSASCAFSPRPCHDCGWSKKDCRGRNLKQPG